MSSDVINFCGFPIPGIDPDPRDPFTGKRWSEVNMAGMSKAQYIKIAVDQAEEMFFIHRRKTGHGVVGARAFVSIEAEEEDDDESE